MKFFCTIILFFSISAILGTKNNYEEAPDYYAILEIGRSASPEDIRRAFKKNACTHHPDKNPGVKSAHYRMQRINEAYETLKDAESRQMYDASQQSNILIEAISECFDGYHFLLECFFSSRE